MKDNCLLVMTSCPDIDSAKAIAKSLVEARLAACIQISSPVTSVYRWQDEVCEEQEYALQIKCHSACFDKIEQAILALHPYEVPELIAVKIKAGSSAYLDWIKETTQI
ncbi:divalent-cation tolerance protein CutA [Shewanella sp. AS1]|uniref:divalent-cation tolerance protein CutA n=1 Tax=Shewanella sp. AS1 TaxID=2907626 RepID=UPI001F1D54E2|nr:divalent-cation tolerance protein CutA [Shewanella sp. AS1]MCE9679272.1 divalent-cation tolerance protein CutA [Shewanella sp. AS1]